MVVENYAKGTAATVNDLSYTSDQLTINFQDDIYMYLDDIDKKQNAYDTMRLNAEEGGIRLANRMDARFLYQVRNATVSCDDGEEVAVIKLGHLLGNLVKSLILIPQTV